MDYASRVPVGVGVSRLFFILELVITELKATEQSQTDNGRSMGCARSRYVLPEPYRPSGSCPKHQLPISPSRLRHTLIIRVNNSSGSKSGLVGETRNLNRTRSDGNVVTSLRGTPLRPGQLIESPVTPCRSTLDLGLRVDLRRKATKNNLV